MTSRKRVKLTTDGACIGNPGPGGWACVLRFGDVVGEMFGHEPHTTNNRMELTAVINGLRALQESCDIDLFTDSQYVRRGMTEWIDGWKARGWVRKERGGAVAPIPNKDLWIVLENEVEKHSVSWHWVRGHAGDPDNDRCDKLANRAARSQQSSNGLIRHGATSE